MELESIMDQTTPQSWVIARACCYVLVMHYIEEGVVRFKVAIFKAHCSSARTAVATIMWHQNDDIMHNECN